MAARQSNSFGRQKSRLKPQPTILIICEDSKSGKNYLEDLCVHFRANVLVEISHCGRTDTKSIIENAISRQSRFDKVFCVIDRDTHATFEEGIQISRNHNKIIPIISYPCFEFWLILHFGLSRRPYTSTGSKSAGDRLIDELRTKPSMTQYNKGSGSNIFEPLLGTPFNSARAFSLTALQLATSENEMNPSTSMHVLVDYIEGLGKPVTNS